MKIGQCDVVVRLLSMKIFKRCEDGVLQVHDFVLVLG